MGNRSRLAPTVPATRYGYCSLVAERVLGILFHAWGVCPIYDITWWLPRQHFTEISLQANCPAEKLIFQAKGWSPVLASSQVHHISAATLRAVEGQNLLIIHESEIEFYELLLWIPLTITDALRSYIKHLKECFFRCANTSKLVLKNPVAPRFSTHFSVFGYLMKHSSLCLIY